MGARAGVSILFRVVVAIFAVWWAAGEFRPTSGQVAVAALAEQPLAAPPASEEFRRRQPPPAAIARALDAPPPAAAVAMPVLEPVHFDLPGWRAIRGRVAAIGSEKAEKTAETKAEVWVEVSAWELNIRSGPSARANRLGSLPRGTRLRVLDSNKTWMQVEHPERQLSGWMHGDYLNKVSEGRSET